jgi:hypothetical protein
LSVPFQLTPPHIALVSLEVGFTVAAFTVVASTVVYDREWQWASVLLRSVLPRWVPPPRVLITGQVTTALPPRSVVHTATIITPPTTAAYRRRNGFNAADIERAEANAAALFEQSE